MKADIEKIKYYMRFVFMMLVLLGTLLSYIGFILYYPIDNALTLTVKTLSGIWLILLSILAFKLYKEIMPYDKTREESERYWEY